MTGIRYDILITHDPDTGWYGVEVPDLPGCYSQGRSIEEAEANAQEAIALHVEGLRELGRDVPTPAQHELRTVEIGAA